MGPAVPMSGPLLSAPGPAPGLFWLLTRRPTAWPHGHPMDRGSWPCSPRAQGWWASWRLTAKVLGGDHSATWVAQPPKGPGKGHRIWVESGKISSFEAGHQGPQAWARGTYSGRSQELGIPAWIPAQQPR